MENIQNCGWYAKPAGGAEHSSVTLMSRCVAPWLLRFQHAPSVQVTQSHHNSEFFMLLADKPLGQYIGSLVLCWYV